MIFRLIPAKWASDLKVLEGRFTDDEILAFNELGYNIYYYPNYPSTYTEGHVTGDMVDVFDYVFVDCDLKDGVWLSKEAFIDGMNELSFEYGIKPHKVIDSGHGVHVYWKIANLDAMSFLKFQRRLCRLFHTDEAICRIGQLMRYPETINTKDKDNFVICQTLVENDHPAFTAEIFDKSLPAITKKDDEYCQGHYDKTYQVNQPDYEISDTLPPKFGQLLRDNPEAKELFAGDTDDRSKADYRLGHIMFANGFTKEEALSVLVNSVKALERAPIHRRNYAINIVDKIWTFELSSDSSETLSSSVRDILSRSGDSVKGTPFRCHPRIDNTEHGFRLGQVIGLVAGSGVGKTAFALNMFRWFAQINPDYHHFFVPLEQPANEIADRWKTMCGDDTSLHDKVQVISNYDANGGFRHLSLQEIEDYIVEFQKVNDVKVGCVVIDHIGALKKQGKEGENQDLMTICHNMKAFAIKTNTLLVMQSQTSREKAGIGDLELDKDAAYGTMYFEAYCDYLITLWQPLKRCHEEPACPSVTAFKFCKIRHKKKNKDKIQEDVPYYTFFDPETEQITDMTQSQMKSFEYFLPKATNKRKLDRKTGIVAYKAVQYKDGTNSN